MTIKSKKSTKKVFSLLLAVVMMVGMVSALAVVPASAATDRVSMYELDPFWWKYGISSYNVYIQTNDNAYNQQVYVHYQYYTDDPVWQTAQASYLTTLNDGSKIWVATVSSMDFKYAIKYVADGQTFWDNNNGYNYNSTQKLGTAPVTVDRLGYQTDYDNYKIQALLQNYAYQKSVRVRYTEDNWVTFSDAPLSYNSSNANNTETWSTTISIDENNLGNFQYCVYYEVNGNTYWANNYGANYDRYYYQLR